MDGAVTCVHCRKMMMGERANPMRLDFEEYIIDIIEHVNAARADRFLCAGIKRMAAGNAVKTVKDSPSIYLVPGILVKDDAMLKISNQEFPESVDREVQKSRVARSVLSDDLAVVVPSPIFDGRFMGRSYAIWPKYRPISDRKIIRAVQKTRLYANLFAWLRGVAEVSINRNLSAAVVDQRCRLPLEHVRENRKHSDELRSSADLALRLLGKGEWHPVGILQHTDFWLGNILLPRFSQRSLGNKFGFFAID